MVDSAGNAPTTAEPGHPGHFGNREGAGTGGGTSAAEDNNRREDTQEPAVGLGEGGKPRDHPEPAEEPEKWSAREAGKPGHSKEYTQAGQ